MWKIIITILAVIYALWPFDLLHDFIIGFGWIDDILVLALVWYYFFSNRAKTSDNYQRFKHQHYDYGQQEEYKSRNRNGTENGKRPAENYDNTPKDPYQILGIEKNASAEEIKKAYRQLANIYHPDKVSHMGKEFQHLAEKKFKEIQEAYQKLIKKQYPG